ncbi:MAG TPA: helix-turn-helix domain-containing protein [Candidatus Methanoperedens sp.]
MNSNPCDDENIFVLLANRYSRMILSLTSKKECSASQLSQELGIPPATVYRRLKLLESTGLIRHVKTIINLTGNEEKYYRCAIREVSVNFHNGNLSVGFKKEESDDKIIRLWKRLAHPDEDLT